MRILIVDDELVSREKLRNIMDSFGQCVVVENGADALRVATSQNPPDLILLDIIMPGMDGYEVCKRLKANRRTSNIPVIVISSKSEEEDEAQGLGLGAVDYIKKPFSPSIVKARVRTHLELKKHRNRLEELVNERTIELKKAAKEMQVEIAERKQAEEALRESEEKYRTILESIEEGYYETNIAGDFTFFNDSLAAIFGYTRDEMLGMNYKKNTDKEASDRLYQVFNKVYTTGKPSKGAEYKISGKDGITRYVEVSVSLLKDTEGKRVGFRGITRDVTERKIAEQEKARLEAQFQQAQKMEATGTLAGGIAHDFNNLLMAMQGNASLVLIDKDSSHPDYERLKNIEECIRDAANLTKQLLGFARGGKYEVKSTDLNTLLKKSSKMFGRTKKEITIQPKYQEDLWAVEADPGQIEQVLLNLYVNAWQAMPGGGELYLETQNTMIDEHYSKPYHVKPGKYVKISIIDTGSGMDEATRKRIFDPFFTTKEMGRGTGLGLASVYGIIKSHGGFIDVDSEKGHGTTFKIHLPATEAGSIAPVVEPDKALEIARGKETILLVDDEDMIIEVGAELLREMGYHVLIARSGREAIEIFSEAHRPGPVSPAPDLVILDMIMPEMSGGETYDRLKEISPGIRVLLSSGYSIDGQATEILERGCNGFIQKPFNIEQLSQKIREVLAKK
jgi:two-component system cell cycle sensor histidine kinase/response regulator CckA